MVKVSIIVPVYNIESHLRKCLDSLVGQSLKEIEIVVINDGSTDCSQSIIDDFAERFPDKIKSFYKENGGLSDARNFGIDRAIGDYLGFVDSDDFVNKEMFLEMHLLAEKHQAEMVICNLQKVDENGKITQKLVQIPNMSEKIDLAENLSVFSDISYFACNKLFHKSLFDGLRFKKGIHFEDIQLVPQLLLKCKTLAQTQNYHYQYFERSDSISKTHTIKGLDILNAVEDVSGIYKNSRFNTHKNELKNFQILEGVYTFLAYLAKVKNQDVYFEMSSKLKRNILNWEISKWNLLTYKRFGKNYMLSLPLKKKIYYLMYFFGFEKLIRKLT